MIRMGIHDGNKHKKRGKKHWNRQHVLHKIDNLHEFL